jgi:cytochrome P450
MTQADAAVIAGFDIADARVFADGHPHDIYDRLRADDPVHFVPSIDGRPPYWLLTRHADIEAVSRDNARFTSRFGFRLIEAGGVADLKPEIREALTNQLLTLDPPRHAELRRPLDRSFLPRALAPIQDDVDAFVDQMISALAGKTRIEFVREVAAVVPIRTLCRLLGIPGDDEDKVFDWTNRLVGTSDPEYGATPEESTRTFDEVFEYGKRLIAERRATPGDDLLSLVARITVDGQPIDGPMRDGMFALLLAAGNETTRNSLTGAIVALTRFPDQKRKLVRDPGLVDGAVDELLRYVTPVIQMMRVALEDIDIGTATIRKGERVVMLYGAANRDPEMFADPHSLDVERANTRRQLGFGIGIHHCLGARLARMQLKALLKALLTRFPDISASGAPTYLRSNFVSGIKELPVRLA